MLRYNVLWDRWVVLAMIGGLALVFTWCLIYLAPWGPRPAKEQREGARNKLVETLLSIPPILWLTYVGLAVFSLTYAVIIILHSANW